MEQNSADTARIVARARAGDRFALDELFSRHRDRLRRMVELRLDRRLAGRVDPSDVIQDAFADVADQLDDYFRDPRLPLFIWMRLLVGYRLNRVHRHHLGTKMRDARREVAILRGPTPEASSAALAARLLGDLTSPSTAADRAEQLHRLQDALNALPALDREVLALRYFEDLSRSEIAQALGVTEEAAAKRHLRALKRLKVAMDAPTADDLP
jgi:RNA polymerase sigma-70 factor (ECF subfamily)